MNVFDPIGWANGLAFEAALHAADEGAVRWVPVPGVFAVLGHAAALEVLGRPERFTSREGTGLVAGGTTGRSLNLDDPPRSLELRRVVHELLERPLPDELATPLIERALAKVEFDALRDLGEPIARAAFGSLLGLGADEVTRLCELTEGLARSGLDDDARRRADRALHELLTRGLDERRPGRFWDTARTVMERGFSADDARFLLRLVVQTGHESTAQAIAGAVHAALDHALPFDGRPAAVEEWLRWTSPLIRFARVAVDDTELAGVRVKKGDRVVVLFPVVNRDRTVFARPDTIDLERRPNPQLAFGAGPHHCLGARLARQQLSAVMTTLASSKRPRLRGPAIRLTSAVTRGFLSVPLAR